VTLLKPPTGRSAVITTIHISTSVVTSTGGSEVLAIFRSSDGTCSLASQDRNIDDFFPSGIGETVLPFDMPGGLPLQAGKAIGLHNFDPNNLTFGVSAYGYAVPSSAVPAS
jgi:hypothetical protein